MLSVADPYNQFGLFSRNYFIRNIVYAVQCTVHAPFILRTKRFFNIFPLHVRSHNLCMICIPPAHNYTAYSAIILNSIDIPCDRNLSIY